MDTVNGARSEQEDELCGELSNTQIRRYGDLMVEARMNEVQLREGLKPSRREDLLATRGPRSD